MFSKNSRTQYRGAQSLVSHGCVCVHRAVFFYREHNLCTSSPRRLLSIDFRESSVLSSVGGIYCSMFSAYSKLTHSHNLCTASPRRLLSIVSCESNVLSSVGGIYCMFSARQYRGAQSVVSHYWHNLCTASHSHFSYVGFSWNIHVSSLGGIYCMQSAYSKSTHSI